MARGVQPAAARLGVVAGQQDLGGGDAVGLERLLPGAHQQADWPAAAAACFSRQVERRAWPGPGRRRPRATGPEETTSTCWPRAAQPATSAAKAASQARVGGAGCRVDQQGRADLDDDAGGRPARPSAGVSAAARFLARRRLVGLGGLARGCPGPGPARSSSVTPSPETPETSMGVGPQARPQSLGGLGLAGLVVQGVDLVEGQDLALSVQASSP